MHLQPLKRNFLIFSFFFFQRMLKTNKGECFERPLFPGYVFFRWKSWQQNFLLLCGMSKISAGFCAIMQILLSLLVLPLNNWNFLYITANTGEYHRCSFFQEKNPGHFRTSCRPWRKYLQSKQKTQAYNNWVLFNIWREAFWPLLRRCWTRTGIMPLWISCITAVFILSFKNDR